MNDDYLWSKRGHDAEVERLEALLTEFRGTETGAVPIAVKNRPAERGPFRLNLRLVLAFGVGALVVFAILGSLVRTDERTMPILAVSVERPEEIADVRRIDAVKSEAPFRKRPVKAFDAPRSKTITPRQAKAVRGTEARSRPSKLTAEEREAYDRLMLALSITGSKLRIVKDKVNGGDK